MKPAPFHFCDVCILDACASIDRCDWEVQEPEIATDAYLVHDGTRLCVERTCDRHASLTLDLAVGQWGYRLTDPYIAYPMFMH